MEELEFKYFLLSESRVYLGSKIGDILNAMQELQEEGPHMGKRQFMKHAERISAMIRRILHSSWPQKETHHLKGLQKIGVAIMKSIEEKGDLEEALKGGSAELEKILANMKVPVNQIGAPDETEGQKGGESVENPEHKPDKPPEPAPPDGAGQAPPQPPQSGQQPPPDATMMPPQGAPPMPGQGPMPG